MLNWIENKTLLVAFWGVFAVPAAALATGGKRCDITLSGERFSMITWTDHPAVVPPQVQSTCNQPVNLQYSDTYFPIGCRSAGLEGYFAPARWAQVKTIGDGGVDVTGVPKSVPVEGAGTAHREVGNLNGTQFTIVAPADGYFSFRMRTLGGSNHLEQPVAILVDGQPALFYEPDIFSPFVRQGDTFTLEFPNAGDELAQHIEGFQFITDAVGVVQRDWTASTDLATGNFRQLYALTKPTLAEVVLPAASLSKPNPETGEGMPFIDRDGDLETQSDQSALNGHDGIFSVEWTDFWIDSNENERILVRKWIISDLCADVIWEKDQPLQWFRNGEEIIHATGPIRFSDLPQGSIDQINLHHNGWPGDPGL